MLQTERRRNPYPLTWEIPVAALLAIALAAAIGVQVGRGLATWFAGGGWAWPASRALLTSIPAILAGDPAAGLTPPPEIAATPGAAVGWIIAVETLFAVALGVLTALILRRWGPARMRGMATPAQVEAALGLRRLRNHRRIIRPDL